MITKIKQLKGIGKFYDFSSKGDKLDWHKITFLFAPNAYGKSTLVSVCRSLQCNDPKLIKARRTLGTVSSPEAVVIIEGVNHVFNDDKWNKICPTIQIFDPPFIHENILSYEIEHNHRKNIHKIVIGARGITLDEQLTNLKINEKEKNKNLEELNKKFDNAQIKQYLLNGFLTISTAEEANVQTSIQKLEQDIKSKESETLVRGLGYPQAVIAPDFDLSIAKTLAMRTLGSTHEEAEKRVLEHIEKNIADTTQAKEFIRKGCELVRVDCPFCGQDLKNVTDLIHAYQEFFDDMFRNYQKDLMQQVEVLKNWNIENELTSLVSAHKANLATMKQWEAFIGVAELPDATAFLEEVKPKLLRLKAAVLFELNKKQRDPNTNVDRSPFDAFVSELVSLKTEVEAYNNAISKATYKAEAYVASLPASDIASLHLGLIRQREIEKRFNPEWKKWASDYETAQKELGELSTEKKNKQEELEEYTKTIFCDYQKRINQVLNRLGSDFEITDLTGKNDARANESYGDFGFLIHKEKVPLKVRQDDMPCFKTTLSEGDKSTLAFAFFIAMLEKMPELKNQIVLLDDPLSSLDETRREATARVLLELSPKVKQLCIFTHKKDFLRMLFDKMPNSKVLQIRSDKVNGSRIEALDVEEDRKSDYIRMVEEMERYVNEDFGPTTDTMQGNIRKVFETVLKIKYYNALPRDIRTIKVFSKLLETLFEKDLLDTALKSQLFNLCNVSNGPHHGDIVEDSSRKLTRDELIPLIQEALRLLKKL